VEDRSIKHLCPVDSERMSLLTIVHQDETPFAAVYKDADAHLIAAAPDLLEALKVARHMIAEDGTPIGWSVSRIDEVIAKAKGAA
jgi:hypothetical protein